ncbi:unnamed protein product [Sphagnum jensenii]|uniref:Uncharacterized protein n=1 Tax=Sphagnum jensenii TaxID=128206 RepID=A0ABP1AE61_9BRYO
MVNKKQVLISRPLKQDIPGDYCGAERPEEKDQGTTRQEVSLRQKTIPAHECVVLLLAVFFCSCLFLRYWCGAVRCGTTTVASARTPPCADDDVDDPVAATVCLPSWVPQLYTHLLYYLTSFEKASEVDLLFRAASC